ncbi:MAG TPA: YCF48-related protein [Terriglobales bacterium]|nr:YCF48-related protein [Terriglobales bacterium]
MTQRLAAGAKAGPHPDPNLLTALVEKSLTERERVQVLAHMAQCADCRDIVAAAQPEFETVRVAAAVRPRSGWLSGNVLRWSAAVACVVVVGAAVTLYRQAKTPALVPRTASAIGEKAVAGPPPSSTTPQLEASSRDRVAPSPAPEKLHANLVTAPMSAGRPAPRAKEETFVANSMASKQLGRQGPAQSQLVAAAPAPMRTDNRPTALPASPMAAAAAPVAQAGELDKKADQTQEVSVIKPADELTGKSSGSLELAEATAGKAKDTEARAKAPAAGMVGGAAMANRKVARAEAKNEQAFNFDTNSVLPRWTLSADGTLQRSLDAGKTWQTIPVPAKVTFRALAAVGAEIWVGGLHGALYHSSDAGGHWLQIKPIADGKPLTADIIGVEFTDARHGKLTTSGGEIWTTIDAGETWQYNK